MCSYIMLLPYCNPQRSRVNPTIAASMKISTSVCSSKFWSAFSFTMNVSVICCVKYGVIMYIDWHTTVMHSASMYIARQPFMFFHSHLKRNILSPLPFCLRGSFLLRRSLKTFTVSIPEIFDL